MQDLMWRGDANFERLHPEVLLLRFLPKIGISNPSYRQTNENQAEHGIDMLEVFYTAFI